MKDIRPSVWIGIAATVALVGIFFWPQSHKDHTNATPSPSSTNIKSPQESPTTMLEGQPLANFTPVTEVTELQKIDTLVGNGEEVKPGDTITAHYTGAVAATGIIFQSSHDRGNPIAFSLDQVIAGWTQGVPGMKVGGTRRLIIPANLAYGANPPQGSGIPANAPLVFDIELVKIGR